MTPIISIVGKSNSGKTTFIEKMVRELKRKHYKVAVVKHDTHGFDIDHPGKDTWRMAQAGSDIVMISSPNKMAMIKKTSNEYTLDQLQVQIMDEVDIILTEGYKNGNKPKIEITRGNLHSGLHCSRNELVAIVTDQRFNLDVPQFGLNDSSGVVELIIHSFLKPKKENKEVFAL
ncbi:MAG: molybdopterin-guanine dinucleotide biosynthesis protein B [Dehalococcoidia bacterium]|nr:MAG: molybdopterin-guanine dinucleotide biosynthesis protein B [Dehalococcoidia bacterium]